MLLSRNHHKKGASCSPPGAPPWSPETRLALTRTRRGLFFGRRSSRGESEVVLFVAAAVILVRDPTGKWAGDPLHPWFESLRNKAGLVLL